MFYPKFMAAVDFLCSDCVGKKKSCYSVRNNQKLTRQNNTRLMPILISSRNAKGDCCSPCIKNY